MRKGLLNKKFQKILYDGLMFTVVITIILGYLIGILALLFQAMNTIFLPGGNVALGILEIIGMIFIVSVTIAAITSFFSKEDNEK